MPLQDITITASINSLVTQSYNQRTYIASSDDQSFPIETITGSYAGVWPDFRLRGLTTSNSASNTTTNQIVNITQSWSESIVTPLGIVPRIHNTMEEFINGEFSGSSYVVSDGNLTDEDCRELLIPSITNIDYRIKSAGIYSSSFLDSLPNGDQLTDFLNDFPSPSGRISIYVNRYFSSFFPLASVSEIIKIKINKEDDTGEDQTLSLQGLTRFSWIDPTIGTISLKINTITEHSSYFLYDVTTNINYTSTKYWGSLAADPILGLTLGPFFVIMEPYLLNDFANSDCDVLMNNAFQNDISQFRQRVLYDEGSTTPSNFPQIMARIAEPAELNDYLYNASDSTLARYIGTRTTSPDFNLPAVSGGYGQLPNVERLQTYFAYYDFIKDTPELVGKSAAHIRYLIDKDGEVLVPSLTSSYYWNLIDNFDNYRDAEIIVQSTENAPESLGFKQIIQAGKYPKTVLSTYYNVGVTSDYLLESLTGSFPSDNFIILDTPEFTLPNYYYEYNLIAGTGLNIAPGGYSYLFFGNLDVDDRHKFTDQAFNSPLVLNTADYSFYIRLGSNVDTIRIDINLNLASGPSNADIKILIEKSYDKIRWETIDEKTDEDFDFLIPAEQGTYFRFKIINLRTTSISVLNSSDVEIETRGISTEVSIVNTSSLWSDSLFINNQYHVLHFVDGSGNRNIGPFWVTGSASRNVLTSSVLYRYYDPNKPYIQQPFYNSIFNEFVPFIIKPGDNVNFRGDNYLYAVQEVIANPIENDGIINTDIWNWNNSDPTIWVQDPINETITAVGGNAVVSQSFNSPLAIGDVIAIEFTVSDWTPVNTSYFAISLNNSINGPDYWYAWPSKNGKMIIYLKKVAAFGPPDRLNIGSSFFQGTISNLKVRIMDFQTARLFVKLNRDVKPFFNERTLQSFIISRYEPDPSYIILNSPANENDGFIFPKYATDELKDSFDKTIVNLKERGLI